MVIKIVDLARLGAEREFRLGVLSVRVLFIRCCFSGIKDTNVVGILG